MATGCRLHLIRPLGFDTDEKACRRAGLDYWPRLGVTEHADWAAYEQSLRPERLWLFSTKAWRPLFDADFQRGDHLVFGKETSGLPASMLEAHPDRVIGLPMLPGERSLNLATAVCAAVYEGVRQMLARGDVAIDDSARLDLGGL